MVAIFKPARSAAPKTLMGDYFMALITVGSILKEHGGKPSPELADTLTMSITQATPSGLYTDGEGCDVFTIAENPTSQVLEAARCCPAESCLEQSLSD